MLVVDSDQHFDHCVSPGCVHTVERFLTFDCNYGLIAVGRQKNKKKLLKERIAEKDEKDKQLQQQQQQAKKPVQ